MIKFIALYIEEEKILLEVQNEWILNKSRNIEDPDDQTCRNNKRLYKEEGGEEGEMPKKTPYYHTKNKWEKSKMSSNNEHVVYIGCHLKNNQNVF